MLPNREADEAARASTVGVVLGAPKASVISNSKAVDVFSPSQIFSQIKDKYNKNNNDNKTKRTIRKKQIPLHLFKT